MAERRLRLDLTAWGFLLAGLLLALCVLSHDSADASGATVYPENAASHNLLGSPGAWIGNILYQTLGISLYVLLISWFVLVLILFFRRRLLIWSLRLAGWVLLIPCPAVAA